MLFYSNSFSFLSLYIFSSSKRIKNAFNRFTFYVVSHLQNRAGNLDTLNTIMVICFWSSWIHTLLNSYLHDYCSLCHWGWGKQGINSYKYLIFWYIFNFHIYPLKYRPGLESQLLQFHIPQIIYLHYKHISNKYQIFHCTNEFQIYYKLKNYFQSWILKNFIL